MNSNNQNTLVLGAGLAGLSVAHYLDKNLVNKCKILEADNNIGGLCRSFKKDDFTYDIGGHILFSKDNNLLQEIISLLGDNILQKRRKNEIWYKDRFIKYPFENGLDKLDKEEIFECLFSFLQKDQKKLQNLENLNTQNLYNWCIDKFGSGIAEKYLIPYNQKIWKRDLTQMSLHWVDRIPSPPVEDIIKSAIGIQTEGYTHQLNFFYPKFGGIESLIKSLAVNANLKRNFKINKIVKNKDEWQVFAQDKVEYCQNLVSTIPIFDLINSLQNVPEKVLQALSSLQYNSLILVMLGVKNKALEKRTAIYVPDKNILPHRVCFMKCFSENNAPENYSHLVAEITVAPDSDLMKIDKDIFIQKVINNLKNICEFDTNDIISTDYKVIKYAYVVYDLDYLKNTKIIFDYLDSLNIFYTGRFGSFKYINMDTCIEMSKDLVFKKLLLNSNFKKQEKYSGRVVL
ncbi:FAD-dependent oxidoreductase [Candidatus Babeliales bacterium]|nr:FAD-dependent oxidoreductase [Candidatus Babeliales bacterium]